MLNISESYRNMIQDFLRELNLSCRFIELAERHDTPFQYRLNISLDIERPRHQDEVYNKFTKVYRDLQNSSLTKKFRDRIEELENENGELKKRLSLKDQIICDTIEEEAVEVYL